MESKLIAMSKHLILFSLAAALLAPAATQAQAADRHAGVYQFAPLPTGYCEGRRRQDYRPESTPARISRLGDLPAAYVIRLTAQAAPTEATPAYDPCATVNPALARVK